jgi:hypothetical protein
MLLSGAATREVMEAALREHVRWVEATPEVMAAFRRLGVRPAKAVHDHPVGVDGESWRSLEALLGKAAMSAVDAYVRSLPFEWGDLF